jgi:flavodoxin I
MKFIVSITLLNATADLFAYAFIIPPSRNDISPVSLAMASVGIFFGTSTGSTEDVADHIKIAFGDNADGPFDIDTLDVSIGEKFEKYDAIVCGTPTWNTGAETERSGTGWDEIYYTSMSELNIEGKHVAVFGCGDQLSYAENFADATGELHDVLQNLVAKIFGHTSQEGYEHEDSKSIRGDQFCGLICDAVNQEELTAERVQNWVLQLKREGFMGPVSVMNEGFASELASNKIESVLHDIDECSNMLDESIEGHRNTSSGFKSYHNERKKTTMFVSADGRSCYYTTDPQDNFSP